MASQPLQFHPDARDEAFEAYDFYAQRSEDVGEAFLAELRAAGSAIQQSPQSWASYLYGTRRYLLKRFPFVVVYRVAETRVEILAVAHGRRRPGYWQDRLS